VSTISAKNSIIALAIGLFLSLTGVAQEILVGADQFIEYVPLLKNKRVAIVANQTSITSSSEHLVDVLFAAKINIVKVFSPEHGFRGSVSAGDEVDDEIDAKTGIPIISLYGKHKKPSAEMLENVDVVLFDIQDVGARFYTYISTLSLVMEVCAENNVQVIVLDRPNPNGHYVDGPTLKPGFESFVGMHHIPVVHGMTIGEYALMVNGEKWLKDSLQCELKVVPVKAYNHNVVVSLPVPPSPNLATDEAIRLYPSLCFFEGTKVSVGRGTDKPFQQIGAPFLDAEFPNYSFVPEPNQAATNPKYRGLRCYGIDLTSFANSFLTNYNQLYIYWLIESYQVAKNQGSEEVFFERFFDKLAGSTEFREQIIAGKTEVEIRESWQPDLIQFKKIRRKYLLYEDFE
jgi:uncharacterized protein YbbC (DUF1343 family)